MIGPRVNEGPPEGAERPAPAAAPPPPGGAGRAMIAPRVIHIDGLACEVGGAPASGMTVGQLRARLAQYPDDAPVGFNTGIGSNLEVLSLYRADDTGAVWLDLAEAVPMGAAVADEL